MSHRKKTLGHPQQVRHQIAIEAARLIARGKVRNLRTARTRAMRWLSQQRLTGDHVPSQEEIMVELQQLLDQHQSTHQTESPAETGVEESSPEELDGRDWAVLFAPLLHALGAVRRNSQEHPEGDVLYHVLQVCQLGQDLHPWDTEFQWACLLHEIGYAVDPGNPQQAATRALHGYVTDRIQFLIENLPDAHRFLRGETTARSLRKHPDFEYLLDLARCDLQGRVAGKDVPTLEAILEELCDRELEWEEDSESEL
ncbi:MAG: hypothetical protein KDA78_04070 [Planctomycetaceae bacterium]|nr:hypothetical protein [Planctomycetaceae bacterium]